MATAVKGKARQQKDKKSEEEKEKEQRLLELRQKQSSQNAQLLEITSSFTTSKPTNVDAQRILTVLEDMIRKVEILSYLDTGMMESVAHKDNIDREFFESLSNNKIAQSIPTEAGYEGRLKLLLPFYGYGSIRIYS